MHKFIIHITSIYQLKYLPLAAATGEETAIWCGEDACSVAPLDPACVA